MLKLIKKIKQFFSNSNSKDEKLLKKYGAITYCNKCKEPLQENSSTEIISVDGLYKFKCNCSEITYFHYGLAPVPIMIEKNDIKNLKGE